MKPSLLRKSVLATGFALMTASGFMSATATAGPNDGPVAAAQPVLPIGTALGSADLWAVINANGTIARSDGANAATTAKLVGFTGAYKVGFFRNVRGCVYVATLGGAANVGVPPNGLVVVEGRFDNVNGVFVQTYDRLGAAADRGFHLFVNC
jgi:hypothetical protein